MATDIRHMPPESVDSAPLSYKYTTSSTSSSATTAWEREVPATPEYWGSNLSQIRSSEIPTAEAYLSRATEGISRDPFDAEERAIGTRGQSKNLSSCGASGSGESKSDPSEKGHGQQEEEGEWTYPDGGLRAWGVILGCFIFISCQMGYGLTWGVLSQNLHENHYKDKPLSLLNLVTGLCNFSMNGACFVSGRLGDKYGYKPMIAIGGVATLISLVISSLVYKNFVCLFIFQGFFLGISQGLGMPSYMAMGSGWFKRRRGLASGIAISGSGFGGAIGSLIIRGVLPRLGYRNSLLLFAGINAVMCFGAFFLLEERRPPLQSGEKRVSKNWLPKGIWNDGAFYSLMGCICLGVFGYLIPYFYITPYATLHLPQIDTKSITLAVPLVVAELGTGFGRIAAGIFADKVGPLNALFLSFFLGGLCQICIWPHATSLAAITVFGGVYGFVGSPFMSLLPAACAQLFGMQGLATITGVAILANSPGQFVGGTIGGVVLSASGYKALAYYSGAVMFSGSLILLYARFSRRPKLFVKY